MKTIETQILEFAVRQWGEKSLGEILNKLTEEVGEVAGAIVKIPEGRATEGDLDKEMGDVLIVLSEMAAKRGKTLGELRRDRLEQIKKKARI